MRWFAITKILDVAGLQSGIEKTLKSLKAKQKEIAEVETAVQGILALEDAFKGKSADAMRNYYKEVHLPFISYYKGFIKDYESKLKSMGNELQALESASNGRIVEAFLAEDLQSSLQNTANHTVTLTDETNQTILSVQDIVAAPLLNDASFLEEVDDAKKQVHDTVEKIHQFDYNQSKALEELSNDVSNMQNYIDRIQSHTKSGEIQLENYTSGTLNKYQIDDFLLDNTCSREDTKEELQKKLANASNLEEFLKIAKEIGDENLTNEQKQIITLWETAKGIKNGAYKAGKDFVKGIFDFVLHPVKTIEGTIDAIAHPIETYDYLKKTITDSYERDVVNGDAKSRAEWFAYALGTIGLSAVGTKGLGAVSKTGMATTKVATKAGASKVKGAAERISNLNLLPYAPRNQLAYANVDVVPYNVVNGAGTKNQLLTMAKMESSGKGTKGKVNGEKDNYFIGTLKGEKVHLKGVKREEIIYTKRIPEETAKLRKKFNSSVKKNFLKEFANDPIRVQILRNAGLGKDDIARMKDGLNPKGWQVHHNLPLDDGGTNDYTNLVLIKNDPYHKAVTNEQISLTRELSPKQSKTIQWPMFEDKVYPPKHFNRKEE